MKIKRIYGDDERTGKFTNEAFSKYSARNDVTLNYDEYCFAAENDKEEIIGTKVIIRLHLQRLDFRHLSSIKNWDIL